MPVARSRRPALSLTLFATMIATLLAAALHLPAEAKGNGPPHDQPPGAAHGQPPGPPAGLPSGAPHEVWALDQGTDLIHVLDQRGREIAEIDVSADALRAVEPDHQSTGNTVPHMIDFDSEYRYAFVAATAGASTIVIDATTKEVVAVVATGAVSHMVAVTPDDSAVWVAAIGAQQMVEIPLDLDADEPTFEVDRRLDVPDLLAPVETAEGWTFPSYSPVCHQYSADSTEAWITLGPGHDQGGLFVLDLAEGAVTAAWDPEDVRANCGVGFNHDGSRVVANWSGTVGPGIDTEGEWYVFDAATKELIHRDSARGFDAHGIRFTPDGRQLWAVNRISDNALIIDARTFRVKRVVADIAKTPDILDFSPDGRLVYITQRGPAPLSGGPHAASGPQPGVAVVHRASARTLRVWEPPAQFRLDEATDEQIQVNDLHGVGVRPAD